MFEEVSKTRKHRETTQLRSWSRYKTTITEVEIPLFKNCMPIKVFNNLATIEVFQNVVKKAWEAQIQGSK